MKGVATKNFLLLRTIFLLYSILIVTEAAGIGRREIELKQAHASGNKLFEMEKDANFQLDDSIVIDYAPVHTSPDIPPNGLISDVNI
ncbi:hypothetical protein K7X08_013673 [Anisodus acutangulus]|uniref:Uncharacterized protein n=1 Tax=Anisodus acutangulus TaxID=402998 RepID=A0A9Q1LKM5_9SOLA|nr:hypothetical protein K7X08_013673 [Anisodus acutangulus]